MTPYDSTQVADLYLSTFAPQLERYQTWRQELDDWRPVKSPTGGPVALTPERFLEHRASGTPIGFYWTRAPSHVAALDFDASDGWEQLRRVQRAFGEAGIPAYGEPSRRGGHMWVVLDAILPAIVLIHGCRAAVQAAGLDDTDPKIEYRPAHDRPAEWGEGMRAPQTLNHRTGRIEPLQDVDGRVLHEKVAGMLRLLEIGSSARFSDLAARYVRPTLPAEASVPNRNARLGPSPIDQFNASVGVSQVLRREWGAETADPERPQEVRPGKSIRCPAHRDTNPSLSIAKDDSRAWCHSPACDLHGPNGRGHDAYSLWTLAQGRAAA